MESDHSYRGRQSDYRYSDSELLDVNGNGAGNVRSSSSAVWKDRLRSENPVSSVVGSRNRRVDCAIMMELPGKGALPSGGDSGRPYIYSINHFRPSFNFVDIDGEESLGEPRDNNSYWVGLW